MKKILLLSPFVGCLVLTQAVNAAELEIEISADTKVYLAEKGHKIDSVKPNTFDSILTRLYLNRIKAYMNSNSSSNQSIETMKYCNEEMVGGYFVDYQTFVVTYQCEDGRYFDQVWDMSEAFKSEPLFH